MTETIVLSNLRMIGSNTEPCVTGSHTIKSYGKLSIDDTHSRQLTHHLLSCLLRGLRNLIPSSTHSSVVRGHVEFLSLGSFFSVDEKSGRLKLHLEVPRWRLDYWQVKRRTS